MASLTYVCFITATGAGVLPYMGYIGMCGPKGYGFSAVLVIRLATNALHKFMLMEIVY